MFYHLDNLPANVTPGWPMPQAIDETFRLDEDGRFIEANRIRWIFKEYVKLYAPGEVRIRIGRPKRTTQEDK